MKALVLPEVEAYAEAHSLTESETCLRLREETYRTMDLPQMVVGPLIFKGNGHDCRCEAYLRNWHLHRL
jgi:hypothetical protein